MFLNTVRGHDSEPFDGALWCDCHHSYGGARVGIRFVSNGTWHDRQISEKYLCRGFNGIGFWFMRFVLEWMGDWEMQ